MNSADSQLCSELRAVYDFEIAHGNTVAGIAAPAGTDCPYAVVFDQPLTILGTPAARTLPASVRYWESRDPHYAIEAGFVCTLHRHSVGGPLVDA